MALAFSRTAIVLDSVHACLYGDDSTTASTLEATIASTLDGTTSSRLDATSPNPNPYPNPKLYVSAVRGANPYPNPTT